MNFILKPWQLFFLILSGWVNLRQQEMIEFQNAQIQTLMDRVGRKRILLTDDQRAGYWLSRARLWAAKR